MAMRIPQTPLAVAVLNLLDERPMHPYEMQSCIRERRIDFVLKLRSGSLYHTVERLHEAGLIEPQETSREGRRPERTVYAITEAGRDEFRAWLRAMLSQPAREYPRFAAALAFMANLPPDEVCQLLLRRIVSVEAELAANDSVLRNVQAQGVPRLVLVEVEYRQALHRSELEFLRGLIREIKEGTLEGTQAWAALHAERGVEGVRGMT